jgi:prepilin-type N-terminal cleavage/methylation domain-containing protein
MDRHLRPGENGFTLIELLVVICILGVISVVAVPNVGKFIGHGKQESYSTELHNVQTAVIALLADCNNRVLDTTYNGVNDMSIVTADNGTLHLDAFMTGLNAEGTVKTGCTYTISQDGGVILQTVP